MTTTIDVKLLLEELKNYPDSIHSFEINEIMTRAVKSSVSKELKLYLTDREIVLKDTIKDSIVETKANILRVFETLENAIIYHRFSSLSHDLSFNYEGQLIYHSRGQRELIYLLRYAITGNFDEDYSESNKIWDEVRKNNPLSVNADMFPCAFEVSGVIVRLFKNGHISLRGITDEQMKRIKDGFDIYTKYRNKGV